MAKEIRIPMEIDDTGGVAVETDPDRAIAQHVESLIGTSPGERVMLPRYGVPTLNYMFEPADARTEKMLTQDIQQALNAWEPGAFLHRVRPVTGEFEGQQGLVRIDVDFSRTDGPYSDTSRAKNLNTARVHVGGQVSEDIRG